MKYLDAAIKKSAKNPDTGFPKLAITGKASALAAEGRYNEARALLNGAMDYAKAKKLMGYEADLLAELGAISAKTSDPRIAIAF